MDGIIIRAGETPALTKVPFFFRLDKSVGLGSFSESLIHKHEAAFVIKSKGV